MTILILLFAAIFVLPDLYISFVLMRDAAWWAHALVWLPTVVAIGLMLSVRYSGLSNTKMDIFTALMLCVALPQIVFLAFSLLGKILSIFNTSIFNSPFPIFNSSFSLFNSLGIAVGAVISLAMLYGMLCGWNRLTVKQVDLSFANLPAEFDGYRVLQLSDLHVGTYGSDTTFLHKVVQRVNQEQPDLVVMTGDLINTTPTEIAPFEQTLSELRAKDGVMAVLGNHDYCLYGFRERPAIQREGMRQVMQAETRMGWQVLLNEHRLIRRGDAQIAIVGVENTGKPPFPEIGDLSGAMKELPDTTFRILLSHDPSHWRMEVLPETDIPLMLAGHTHAGQLKIGYWSPSKWLYREWSGLYQQGLQYLYVSEGIGGSIRFRLGATPEIIILTLHKK